MLITFRVLIASIVLAVGAGAAPTPVVDDLVFGDVASEAKHQIQVEKSEVEHGALGQSARRLLAGDGQSWEGGKVSFIMKIDPEKPNYLTARFWGDEVNANYLVLFCEGKQVGYRHLGDIDVLALPDDEPRYNAALLLCDDSTAAGADGGEE